MSRRRFLAAGCAACAGAAAGGLVPSIAALGASRGGDDRTAPGPLRIRIVHSLHAEVQDRPDWPNVGFDFRPVMERMHQALAKGCPGTEFLSSMATGPEEAKKILEEDAAALERGAPGVDGYLVTQMNCWNQVVQTVAASGKPVLYTDLLFAGSGGFLVYTAGCQRSAAANVGFVASSRLEDLVEAARCFTLVRSGAPASEFAAATARVRAERTPKPGDLTCKPDPLDARSPRECLERMHASKILAIGGAWPGIAPAIHEEMGIAVVEVPFAELNDAWKAADRERCLALVDDWEKSASKIEGVSCETLEASAAMVLAEQAILERHGADAVTINCLGGFYGGHIHAYPCLGFHELANQGLVGACECDLRSTATWVTLSALTGGRPGYISDPVLDTAERRIVYAHCVASNRPFGPAGPANPFEILTHSEDRQGASVRSLLPLGYMTTTVELAPERKEMLLHKGKAVANVDEDRACRTKLAVEPVGDFEKLFREWDRWGWHRVTVYGDLEEPLLALADTLGWSVIREA